MKKNNETLTAREQNHRMIDVISDAYMEEVKWLLQGFAAKSLNEEYMNRQKK